jgi:predicted alpha/beta superfamily hydrolase
MRFARSASSAAVFAVLAWLPSGCASAPRDPVPDHDRIELVSRHLGETRTMHVYVPPGYDEGLARYPVLYMPDGGLQEDFPHLANTVDELIRAGAIAPCLLVGIENTERRRDLTGPTEVAGDLAVAPRVGGSAAFRAFVRDELIPAIEARYRCTARRAIVGESLAGLFVVETLLLQPDLFERYVAISPSLWWNRRDLVQRAPQLLAAFPPGSRTLWLTNADETDIAPHCAELAAILRRAAPKDLTWTYAPRRDLKHHTIFRATKAAALRSALWQP